MAREAQLPPVFDRYAGKVHLVQQVSETEFSSSCPKCGGDQHPGGEWSDRCRWFLDSRPLGWCRRCSSVFWPDADTKPDPVALEAWRKEQVQREEARKRSAELALANLAEHRIWMRYHEQMDEHARILWRKRGVCDSLQDYWQLGYDQAHRFWKDGHEFESATLAIPIFGQAWNPLNIKHRLIAPPADYSKYRYELKGVTDGLLWRADPDADLGGHVIAIEGEIKAMVTAERGGTKDWKIVGLPGTNPAPAIVAQLRKAERVTLVMDPDAKGAGVKLANAIGVNRCWMLSLPHKIDDGIIAANMSQREVTTMLRGAVRLSAYVTGAK